MLIIRNENIRICIGKNVYSIKSKSKNISSKKTSKAFLNALLTN